MAAIIESKGKALPRIDMTPMVDLGFLLITFFVLTTSLSKQKTLNLSLPSSEITIGNPLKKSRVLQVIVGNKKFASYFGDDTSKIIYHNNSTELRKTIILHKKTIAQKILDKTLLQEDQAILFIKPTSKSDLGDMVEALDELSINNIIDYSVIDASVFEEKTML
jgi:biopolymer transport protein ExbD